MYAAVHTLSGHADFISLDVADGLNTVKTAYKRQNDYYMQINPNKAVSDTKMIRTFSHLKKVLDETLEQAEAENFCMGRVDLAFNSDYLEDYELFKKLNRLLLCCIAKEFNIKNCYETKDLMTFRSLSTAVKGERIEAENYNKELESKGKTDTKNRLEIRSLRLNGKYTIEEEFLENWSARLDRSIEQFENVQAHYNDILVNLWLEDRAKPKKEQVFVSATAFLLQFQNCIYSRKQLQSFYEQIGHKNPQNAAKKFKDNHKIEFYSKTDLKEVVKALKQAMSDYFTT